MVCRIFQKHGSGPQNGAQYGAPYMEEEWEEEDDAIENAPANGTSAGMATITCTVDEESNEEDENGYCKTNELAQVSSTIFFSRICRRAAYHCIKKRKKGQNSQSTHTTTHPRHTPPPQPLWFTV